MTFNQFHDNEKFAQNKAADDAANYFSSLCSIKQLSKLADAHDISITRESSGNGFYVVRINRLVCAKDRNLLKAVATAYSYYNTRFLNMKETSKQTYNIFLDDERNPKDVTWVESHINYEHTDWVVVRNFDEFVKTVKDYGLPSLISFDHDLADVHYTPEALWNDYEASKEYQENTKQSYPDEKSGYDCAKFLVDYMMENDIDTVPDILVHSKNPVGRDNIIGLFRSLEKYKQIFLSDTVMSHTPCAKCGEEFPALINIKTGMPDSVYCHDCTEKLKIF